MSEEALQIVEKRTEMKVKGERECHTQVNAEFQRRTRRDKNAFLNEQRKSRDITLPTKVCLVKARVFPRGHVWM